MSRPTVHTRFAVAVIAGCAAVGALATPGGSEVYRWSDEQGNRHYTDGLDAVAPRYRARAVPLKIRTSPVAAVPAPLGSTPDASAPHTEQKAPDAAAVPVASGGTSLRFTPGEPIVVTARINGQTSARVLLDASAPRTLLKPRILLDAGLGRVSGAVVLGSIQVDSATVTGITAGVAPQPNLEQDGVLGRDFLDQFRMTDKPEGYLTLSPKPRN